jgi:hypothetical protein
MSHAYHHSLSSAKKYGGEWEDYMEIHEWFDQTKAHVADARHRMVLHNSFGIFLCEQVFGEVLTRKSDGKKVPVRFIGEQHVTEDLRHIPSLDKCLSSMTIKPWMSRKAKKLSQELTME